jgi:hypothetical protein
MGHKLKEDVMRINAGDVSDITKADALNLLPKVLAKLTPKEIGETLSAFLESEERGEISEIWANDVCQCPALPPRSNAFVPPHAR